jgi:hypothetical protein
MGEAMNDRLFPDNVVELKPWQIHRMKDTPRSIHPSQTSQDASISILHKQPSLQEKVYEAIRAAQKGLIDEEIAEVTGLAPNTSRPRRIELQVAGRIESLGTRPTKSGRKSQIWTVKA